MYLKVKKSNLFEQVFFFSYTVYLVTSLLSQTFFYQYYSDYYQFLIGSSIAILVIKEMIEKKTSIKAFSGILIAGVLSMVVYFPASGFRLYSIIALIWLVFAARNIKFSKVASYTVFISTIVLIFVVTCSQLGIVTNYVGIASDGRERQYLGFLYSLYPSTLISNIILLEVYIKKEKIKYKTLLVLFIANYYMYSKTLSRLTFGIGLFVIFVALVLKLRPKWIEIFYKTRHLMYSTFGILCIGSVYIQATFNSSIAWQRNLDELLEGRLKLGHLAIIQYGLNAIGSNILWVGSGLTKYGEHTTETYNYVDNFYVQTILQYGLIFAVIIVALLSITVYKLIKTRDYYAVFALIVLALHGLIDDLIIYLHYNTFWFLIASILMGRIIQQKVKGEKWQSRRL